ncbi:TrmH family RNA methyltransferase [Neolewinella antarctica]|uniref:TrmH family RNA methyltransferase n=1 Tax=Neolewinella antarctica TaxID=442734 RepID=A0ABX0XE09_9BACT|nr:RNA methyltransferase [Neolewinella antarctica]NJC27481.1 TrmH family RNA methyltransferase [Neolewinella antarctica]
MPISSGTIKFISSLRRKKVRQNYHKFTAEGGRIVGELLGQDRYRVEQVYAVENWVAEHGDSLRVPVTTVTEKELGRISQLTTPNQVLAVVATPEISEQLPTAMAAGWSLYLDGIQSPSNLGALLRIADWFGCQHVVGGPGTADLYNSKSIQASMGSFLRIDYREGHLSDITTTFPDLITFGADLDGENIYTLEAPDRGVLVIGAEGPGVGELARSQVQRWVTIPRGVGRRAESLNAAVAAGILVGGLVK